MRINLTAHIKQHAGDILLECQDSFDYNLEKMTFSVSDGVSQAYRPELWSRLLTSAYVNNPDSIFVTKEESDGFALNPQLGLATAWHEEVNKAYENATMQERFLLDMKRDSISIGAATFIGVQLQTGGIEYYTIGDSVLFFFDYDTKTLTALSSMIPENGDMVFNNSPEYIDTNEKCNGSILHGILPYKKGILFLATDALSDWIVDQRDFDVEKTLKTLMQIPDHDSYDQYIDKIRSDSQPKKLKDDDTTFIALEFVGIDDNKPEFVLNYAVPFKNLVFDDTINDLKRKSEELDDLKSAKFNLERTLKQKEKDFEKLSIENGKQLNELKNCQADIGLLQSTKRGLESQIDGLNRQIEKANSQITTLSDNNRTLESQKRQLESENKRINANLSQAQIENGKLAKENQRLEDLIKKKKGTVSTITSVGKENDERSEISRLQNELNQSQAKLLQAQKELELLKKRIGDIKSSYDNTGTTDMSDLIRLFDTAFGVPPIGSVIYIESTTFKKTKDGGFEI